jgi:hypothetical protein
MLTPDNGDALVMQSGAMLTSARTGEQKCVNAGVEHNDRADHIMESIIA